MSPRRNAGARRAGGLLLAAVLIASQASAWFHAVAISHVACLEHGEAVHRRVLPAQDVLAPRPDGAGALSADLAGAAGHDHCANAALLRWRDVVLAAPASLSAFVPVVRATPFVGTPDVALASAVYRLAPKTSPPASV